MKHPLLRRVALVGVLALLSLVATGTSLAQDGGTPTPPPPPPPPCVADAATGVACAKIVFYPATLKADLFLVDPAAGEAPTDQVQQSALYVTFTNPAAGQTINVVVKNIHDGGKDEGTLYQYPDIPKTVTAPYAAGQTTTVTLYPVKTYVRGKINAKCDIKSVQAGEDVACALSIDGVAQTIPAPAPTTPPTPMPDGSLPPAAPPSPTMAAGQTASFVVEPGKHDVKFDLVGANAALWAPASLTKTVTVTAGAYPQVATATFLKAGHIVATLDKAADGWVGDFYLDGTLVGAQVGSIDQWVAANASHKVEVRKITHPLWPLIHMFQDGTATAYTTSGATSNVTIKLVPITADQMVFPFLNNPDHVVPSSKYVILNPGWIAATEELAQSNWPHIAMRMFINGQDLGELSPYRTPIEKTAEGYHYLWVVSLGKLDPGTYQYEKYWLIDAVIFDGWDFYQPGIYAGAPLTFTVVP